MYILSMRKKVRSISNFEFPENHEQLSQED